MINSNGQVFFDTVDKVTKIDLREIRRDNIKGLIYDRFAGRQADFAMAAKRNPTQVNHWVSGHRNPNGDTCRDIEDAIGLEREWLDKDHYMEQSAAFDKWQGTQEDVARVPLKGNKMIQVPDDWPFDPAIVSRQMYEALSPAGKTIVQVKLLEAIREEESQSAKQQSAHTTRAA